MAKKEATPNMVEQFAEFKELKNIDKTTMISVLEDHSATYWQRCLAQTKISM